MLERVERRLPEFYVVVALALTALLCFVNAPFFGPDEPNQACRAISLSHGQIVEEVGKVEPGGEVDSGALVVMDRVSDIRMSWEKRAGFFLDRSYGPMTEQLQRPFAGLRWSHSAVFAGFGNTASYPPFLYLPAAVGWRAGEALDLTIFQSLRLARMLCALTAVALGWLALRLCACSRWGLLMFLLLPSTLFLNASCSQDAILLAVAAMIAAILSRPLVQRREFQWAELIAVAGLLALCALARPPYLAMSGLVFLPTLETRNGDWQRWLRPVVALAAIVAALAAWHGAVAAMAIDAADEANPALQRLFVQTHPVVAGMAVLRATAWAEVDFSRRGLYVVGWNDLLAPRFLSVGLGVCLVAAVVLGRACPVRTSGGRWLLTLCVTAPLLAITAAEYFIWTPPGLHTVYGVQPRYWLPVMPLAMMLAEGRLPLAIPRRLRAGGTLASAALFAVIACTLPWVAAHAFYREGLWRVLMLNLQ